MTDVQYRDATLVSRRTCNALRLSLLLNKINHQTSTLFRGNSHTKWQGRTSSPSTAESMMQLRECLLLPVQHRLTGRSTMLHRNRTLNPTVPLATLAAPLAYMRPPLRNQLKNQPVQGRLILKSAPIPSTKSLKDPRHYTALHSKSPRHCVL